MSKNIKLTFGFGSHKSEPVAQAQSTSITPLLQVFEVGGQNFHITPQPGAGFDLLQEAVTSLPSHKPMMQHAANQRRMPSKNFKPVYTNFTQTIDLIEPEKRELFLTKLALFLAKEVDDIDKICDLIDLASHDL